MTDYSEAQVLSTLLKHYDELEDWAIEAYRFIYEKKVVMPEEVFLHKRTGHYGRFISMGCIIEGLCACHKWISSFPDNAKQGLPRGSALITLSELEHGSVVATLAGGDITRYRTVTGAVAVLRKLRRSLEAIPVCLIGCGALHTTFAEYWLRKVGHPTEWTLYDCKPSKEGILAEKIRDWSQGKAIFAERPKNIAAAMRGQRLVSFATTEQTPHVRSLGSLVEDAVVLHLSLRDLRPACIRDAWNITDDVTQAITQKTSLDLAVRKKFINPRKIAEGGDALFNNLHSPVDKRVILSPFGLAVFDGLFAQKVHEYLKGT